MNKRGFTLVELLGVIVIIGLVVGGGIFGIIKLIEHSKNKSVGVSISSIEKAASVYATEKNNDNDYWIEMTRKDISGKYFCTTIGELQNKGLLDNDIDLDSLPNSISKSTYVGIVKDNVTLVNSNPMLLNEAKKDCIISDGNCSVADKMLGVCTGNILNEKITVPVKVSGDESYTDEIPNIIVHDIEGENIEIDKSVCYYKKVSDNVSVYTKKDHGILVNNKTCSIGSLDDDTEYSIRVCTYTKGGSQSCSDDNDDNDNFVMKTKKVLEPEIKKGDNVNVNISYNTTGIKENKGHYYFNSSKSGTTTISVTDCGVIDFKENEDGKFTCSGSTTTSIEEGHLYLSSKDEVSITYSSEGNVTVKAKTCDETGNCAGNSGKFSIYKNTFKKSNADSIGGITTDIDKLCIANEGGSCSVISPSIVRSGYTAIGWNRNSNATTSEWDVNISKSVSSSDVYYPITEETKTYTVSYDANGGSGVPSSQTKYHNQKLILSTTKPTRSGYTFSSWNTQANGRGTPYSSGSTYTGNADITLYAIWQEKSSPPTLSYSPTDTDVCAGTKVILSCSDNSDFGMKEAKMVDAGTTTTGKNSTSQTLATIRDGNIKTIFTCTDNAGNVSTKTVYYTVKNCSSNSGGTTTKSCPSGYSEYSSSNSCECRKYIGAATQITPCSLTCRSDSMQNKKSCGEYSNYCKWDNAGRGACTPFTQYEDRCLKYSITYSCSLGNLFGNACYYCKNKS